MTKQEETQAKQSERIFSRYLFEQCLEFCYLFDPEWRKRHPDAFNEGAKGRRVGNMLSSWSLDENGEKIYEEEWSTR